MHEQHTGWLLHHNYHDIVNTVSFDQCLLILQQPKSLVLSQEGHYKMKNGQMKYVQRKETLQYIPILETLTALLNHPDILTEVYVALIIY